MAFDDSMVDVYPHIPRQQAGAKYSIDVKHLKQKEWAIELKFRPNLQILWTIKAVTLKSTTSQSLRPEGECFVSV